MGATCVGRGTWEWGQAVTCVAEETRGGGVTREQGHAGTHCAGPRVCSPVMGCPPSYLGGSQATTAQSSPTAVTRTASGGSGTSAGTRQDTPGHGRTHQDRQHPLPSHSLTCPQPCVPASPNVPPVSPHCRDVLDSDGEPQVLSVPRVPIPVSPVSPVSSHALPHSPQCPLSVPIPCPPCPPCPLVPMSQILMENLKYLMSPLSPTVPHVPHILMSPHTPNPPMSPHPPRVPLCPHAPTTLTNRLAVSWPAGLVTVMTYLSSSPRSALSMTRLLSSGRCSSRARPSRAVNSWGHPRHRGHRGTPTSPGTLALRGT